MDEMNLYQRMVKLNPDRHPVFTAIELLTATEDIRCFYAGYIADLKTKTGLVKSQKDEPEAIANKNIGYVVGDYTQEIADRWMQAIPQVSHPIFGREIPFNNPEEAFITGKNLAKRQG